jgi:hypothetical protein
MQMCPVFGRLVSGFALLKYIQELGILPEVCLCVWLCVCACGTRMHSCPPMGLGALKQSVCCEPLHVRGVVAAWVGTWCKSVAVVLLVSRAQCPVTHGFTGDANPRGGRW